MNNALFALEKEIGQLSSKIAAERQALAAIENRTEQGFDRTPAGRIVEANGLRERIAALEIELQDKRNIRDSLLLADGQRRGAEVRRAKWRALQKECREAHDDLNRLEVAVFQSRGNLEFARTEAKKIYENFAEHNYRLLCADDFPKDSELEDERDRGLKLQERLAVATARAKEADVQHLRLVMEVSQAQGKFEQLRFSERNMRPSDER